MSKVWGRMLVIGMGLAVVGCVSPHKEANRCPTPSTCAGTTCGRKSKRPRQHWRKGIDRRRARCNSLNVRTLTKEDRGKYGDLNRRQSS